MVLPPPPCYFCSLQNGVYISKEDGSVQTLRNDTDKFINATCPKRFQCVGAIVPIENIGCCVPCSFEQACAESTISRQHPFTDNICPDGHLCNDPSAPQPCLAGNICKYNHKVDCVELQKNATDNGIGFIFDGTYCSGSAFINNCPTGYYCPTPKEKIECPAGFFCPMKTTTPQIKCSKCLETSKHRVRDNSVAVSTLGLFATVLIIHYISTFLMRLLCYTYREKSMKEPFKCKDIATEIQSSLPTYLSKDFLGIELRYTNLSLSLRQQKMLKDPSLCKDQSKCILNDVNGKILPRRICAILGESGTGKSSLLKLLSGRGYCTGDVRGCVSINKYEFKGAEWNCCSVGKGTIKSIISYVPQDDIVYRELTVWENLYWAGRFSLSAFSKDEEVRRLTDKVIIDLALEHVRNLQVGNMHGGISGGERRRVSIGIALMSKPRILLCDEITSGLDSSSSMMVMTMLKKLAHEHNMSVLCSIHQPRQQIFSLIDDLVLLCKGGNVLYSGDAGNVLTYFENIGCAMNPMLNPADFLLDLSTGNAHNDNELKWTRQELCSRWSSYHASNHPKTQSTITPATKVRFNSYHNPKPSPIHQFLLQLSRNNLFLKRNTNDIIISTTAIVFGSVVMSFVEGIFPLVDEDAEYLIPFENIAVSRDLPLMNMYQFSAIPVKPKLQFAVKIATVCGVLTSFAASRTISSKKGHVRHEVASGYNPSSYFFAITIISIFEHGLQMMFAGAVSYWILQPLQPLLFYVTNFFMLGFVMSGWGHFFALVLPFENSTLTSGAILLCLNLLYSGVTKPATFEEIYASPRLATISGFLAPSRYFVESLVVSELQCFPQQYGFTKSDMTSSLSPGENSGGSNDIDSLTITALSNFTVMDKLHLAINDKEATLNSNCNGWYYHFPHYIMTGLVLRVATLIVIHFIHQNGCDIIQIFFKRWQENLFFISYFLFLVVLLISLIWISMLMIVP